MPLVRRNSELPRLLRTPGSFFRRHGLPVGLMLAAAVADGWTTFINMSRYAADIELHPAQRWMSLLFGVTAGVPLAKAIQVGFVLLVCAWWGRACDALLYTCALFYALAALNNHFLWL